MNKVFKVIWSEARNAYVVVSEIAKNHGSKSCSTKKLLAMLIATGVMTCASMAPAMAANPASDDLNVTIGKGAHVSVWNGVSGQTISGDIAVGQNAHAWNGEYTYDNKYARIGTKEYLMDFGQGAVETVTDLKWGLLPVTHYKVADGSKIAGSIAIGKNTVARTGSVMLGDHSYTGKLGDIEINPANAMTYNDGIYSTTLGAGAYNSGSLAAVTGALSIASGSYTKNTGATIYGSMNSIESATSDNIYSGVASSVLGFANRTQNANAALIWGTGNEVTNSVEDIGINTNWNNVSVADAQKKAIEAMQSSKYAGGSVMAIGGGNKADYAKYSQLTGVQNKVTGTEANAAKYDFVNGYQNTVTNASDVTVIGIKNKVTADGNKVIGDNHKVSGKNNVIFGSADKVTETTVNNAVVLGHNAKVTGEGGVALGVGSVASTVAGALGYGAAEGETGIAWKATNGAVSVGSSVEGKKITRQITNVAAGTEDTDAVNVAQLKKVSEAAASASQGWKLKTQNGNASDVKPGATVEFDGDANIQVGNDGNKVSVTLKDALTGITSITGVGKGAGSISFANDGIKFNNKVTIDNTGKISGVADGKISTDSTDAVNGSQLNAVKEAANKGWNLSTGKGEAVNVAPGEIVDFSGDDNIKVSNTGKYVKVELEKNLTGLTSVTTNNAYVTKVDASKNESVTNVEYVKNQIADAALSAGNGISITDKKINVKLKDGEQNLVVNQDGLSLNTTLNGMQSITGAGGGKISFSGGNVTINHITFNNDGRIQNVANGTENTDAVNFGQLQAVKNELIASDKDTHIDTSKEYNVGANNQIKLDVLDKDGKKLDQQVVINDVAKASDVGNVNDIADDLKNGGEGKTTVVEAVNNLNNKLDTKVGDLQYSKVEKGDIVDGDSTTTAIGKLDQKLTDVAATAAKHTKVEGSSNIIVTNTAKEGEAANYKVELKKDIDVDTVKATTVTTGQTVMNNDGVKVGKDVSVTATAVTAGKTSISDEGVKVDGKTYISANGLNANDKKVTNVADGKVEKDSKDAINGGQLHQAKADINNRIDGVENQVISNSNRINQLGNRVNKVGAGAAALAALHPMDFDPDDKLTFSAGYGNYGGENAAAIGAYYRPDEKVMFSVGGTVGNGENMVNAGISFALDRTNHVSNSRTALAREVIDLRGQLAVMGAKMAKMEKALGMLDETKTKLFPDIPANHWAYEYIAKLAGNGYIEGYPDGNFGGDRLMTRYEFAAMLYRAIENGAALEEKIIKEFEPELGRIRVDRISGEDGDRNKIERVRVNDTKGERDHYGNKLAK
ncbi:ESPR-type extended signal peptide-containing protein [Phascolarctobacterium succinatutens]|uniref:ESPR-type extended signal peptide-containing protein n=1 Tax=Phascolarctobacterium succinatutens TaxID=626940 RepID=UPI0023F852FD|nr:ESPR-type extended signal peptide-containing protein [Phascolarctobacterium succinatutens]